MKWNRDVRECVVRSVLWIGIGIVLHSRMQYLIGQVEKERLGAQLEMEQMAIAIEAIPVLQQDIQELEQQEIAYKNMLPYFENDTEAVEKMMEIVGVLEGEVLSLVHYEEEGQEAEVPVDVHSFVLSYRAQPAAGQNFLQKLCATKGLQITAVEVYVESETSHYSIVQLKWYGASHQV
ncbi:MAG: hypothetical protein ACRDDX_11585 [Cellulosilyticaceae bacterium]